MPRPSALHAALDLARHPILATAMRRHPLPDGALTLIRIAAGSEETLQKSAAATGYTPDYLRQASVFYIQQIMFSSGDSYRTIGVRPEADAAEMAENVRWLMKWLHPDSTGSDASAVEARRVLAAWTNLKSPERRQSYDAERMASQPRAAARPKGARRGARVSARRPPVIHGVERTVSSREKGKPVRWRAFAATAVFAVLAMGGLLHILMS